MNRKKFWRAAVHIVFAAASVVGCAGLGKKVPAKPEETDAKLEYQGKEYSGEGFPEANALAVQLVPKWVADEQDPTLRALRFYVVEDEWRLERASSGMITSRGIAMKLFVQTTSRYQKGPDYMAYEEGSCYSATCWLDQEEQGGSWGNPKFRCAGSEVHKTIRCASVEALPKGLEAAATETR